MLGHAELREIDEALAEERAEGSRSDKNGPYITPHFAFGLAVTRAAAAAGIKTHFPASLIKR
jgi:hypothetical protein